MSRIVDLSAFFGSIISETINLIYDRFWFERINYDAVRKLS